MLVPFAIWDGPVDAWFAEGSWRQGRALLPATILAGLLVADGLLPVPSSFVSTLLGALLGALGGTLASAGAMTGGVLLAYGLGRWAGRAVALRLVGPEGLARATDGLDRRGAPALALCRPVPLLAEASVIAAGAAGMRIGPVLLATGLSNLGISAVYVGAGVAAQGPGTFALAIVAAFLLPGAALLLARRFRLMRG